MMQLPPSIAARLADALADGGWRARARPAQLPPEEDWIGWIINAGRGWGKTVSGSNWVVEGIVAGECKRVALIAPTASDARDVMIEGETGLLAVSPRWCRPQYEPSKRKLSWPNGAVAYSFSSEEADRLRGPQFDRAWCDELAAWNDPRATWDMLQLFAAWFSTALVGNYDAAADSAAEGADRTGWQRCGAHWRRDLREPGQFGAVVP
jgi:phage terminase large subunit-like protein